MPNKPKPKPRPRSKPRSKPRYPKPDWAVGQVARLSGLLEDTCEHGVGHPNSAWLKAHPKLRHLSIHGCDGCCREKRHPPANPRLARRKP